MACKHGNHAMYCGWCENLADLANAHAEIAALKAECNTLREQCAKRCESLAWPGHRHTEYIQGQNDMAKKCADATREAVPLGPNVKVEPHLAANRSI